jgi:hypothetical protein
MSKQYSVAAAGITLANQAVTLAFVNPGVTRSLEFLRAWVGQSANATSAQQRVQLNTQVTAFPTLTSATPAKLTLSDAASEITGGAAGAAGTAGINASAEGAGAKTVSWPDAFNVLNGWLWVPTPKEVITLNASAASGLGLHLPVAPATLTNWAFGVVFGELG